MLNLLDEARHEIMGHFRPRIEKFWDIDFGKNADFQRFVGHCRLGGVSNLRLKVASLLVFAAGGPHASMVGAGLKPGNNAPDAEGKRDGRGYASVDSFGNTRWFFFIAHWYEKTYEKNPEILGHIRRKIKNFGTSISEKTPIFRELWDIPAWCAPIDASPIPHQSPSDPPSILLHTSGGWSGWQLVSHLPGQGEGTRV